MKWIRRLAGLFLALFLALSNSNVHVQAGAPKVKKTFDAAVKKIEATIDPPTVKRGQTATWRLTVELNENWYTYATYQPDKEAESSITIFTFPKGGDGVFVGKLSEPPYKTKSESAEIKELRYYPDKVVWERPIVIKP